MLTTQESPPRSALGTQDNAHFSSHPASANVKTRSMHPCHRLWTDIVSLSRTRKMCICERASAASPRLGCDARRRELVRSVMSRAESMIIPESAQDEVPIYERRRSKAWVHPTNLSPRLSPVQRAHGATAATSRIRQRAGTEVIPRPYSALHQQPIVFFLPAHQNLLSR